MTRPKLISLFTLLLLVFTFASAAAAQGSRTDLDGDGIPNNSDRCPREAAPNTLDGCPNSPTLTPIPQHVEDRDGDGVLDFVDQCPDQAGTGFTQGCPADQPTPTPAAPILIWHDMDHCLVGNPGPEVVNVRAFIPDPNNPAQPVIIATLQPGDQFAPLYMQLDANNTPWYAGVGADVNAPDGMVGWVSGQAVITNGQCNDLGFPPTTSAPADRGICLILIPQGERVRVFTHGRGDAQEIARLDPGVIFAADQLKIDGDGVRWYRGYEGDGWVLGSDILPIGNCDPFIPPLNPPGGGSYVPLGGGWGGGCIVMAATEDGVDLYSDMLHDPSVFVAHLHAGYAFQVQASGLDASNHLWYYGGTWVDSSDVLATGACDNLPAPPTLDFTQCLIYIPGWNPDVNMYETPSSDPAGLIYGIPSGLTVRATANTWDASSQRWFWAAYGQGGWVSGAQVLVLNPARCGTLPVVALPDDPTQCLITIPEGDGVAVYYAPAHDESIHVTTLSPGFASFANASTTVAGTVWYNIGGWVDSHQVIASGNCGSLPPYTYPGADCTLYISPNLPTVYLYDTYESPDATNILATLNPGTVKAYHSATDSNGVRWYWVVYTASGGGTMTGWVSSNGVIESIPEICASLMPMITLDPSHFIFYPIFHPIPIPLPDPYRQFEFGY
ncbi:MAG: thrombospondin type 3 repeat-containing protein [Anaerolineae bacterium]